MKAMAPRNNSNSKETCPEHSPPAPKPIDSTNQELKRLVLVWNGSPKDAVGLGITSAAGQPRNKKEVRVTSVQAESVAGRAGVLMNDRITRVADRPFKDHHECKTLIKQMLSRDGRCPLMVERQCKPQTRAATPIANSPKLPNTKQAHTTPIRRTSLRDARPTTTVFFAVDVKDILEKELRRRKSTENKPPRGIIKESRDEVTQHENYDAVEDKYCEHSVSAEESIEPHLSWVHEQQPPHTEVSIQSDVPPDRKLRKPRQKSNNAALNSKNKD